MVLVRYGFIIIMSGRLLNRSWSGARFLFVSRGLFCIKQKCLKALHVKTISHLLKYFSMKLLYNIMLIIALLKCQNLKVINL